MVRAVSAPRLRCRCLHRPQEQREKERAEKEPSCTVLVHGIPLDATEERVEVVAWEASVQAGASMPTGVHFAYDRASQDSTAARAMLHVRAVGARRARMWVDAGGSGRPPSRTTRANSVGFGSSVPMRPKILAPGCAGPF